MSEVLKERDEAQVKVKARQREFENSNFTLLMEKDSVIEGLLKEVQWLKDERDKLIMSSTPKRKGDREIEAAINSPPIVSPANSASAPKVSVNRSSRRLRTPSTNMRSMTPNNARRVRTPTRARSTTPTRSRRAGEMMTSGADMHNNKRYSSMIQPFSGASMEPITDPKDVRLMIINLPVTSKLKKIIKFLKIELLDDAIENATKATHVIAGDANYSLRRTPKLMVCLCCTSYVLHLDWLLQSFEAKTLLNPTDYLLIYDELAEKRYRFSMRLTLKNGSERREEGGLFAGWSIFFCRGVAGNNAPKEEELNMIVKAAGGSIITYSDLPLPYERNRAHIFVITSDPATEEQTCDYQAATLAKNGAGFYTTTWLFGCIIHQKLFGIKRGLGKVQVSTNETNSRKERPKDSVAKRKMNIVGDSKLAVSFKGVSELPSPTGSESLFVDESSTSFPYIKQETTTTEVESTRVAEDLEREFENDNVDFLDKQNDADSDGVSLDEAKNSSLQNKQEHTTIEIPTVPVSDDNEKEAAEDNADFVDEQNDPDKEEELTQSVPQTPVNVVLEGDFTNISASNDPENIVSEENEEGIIDEGAGIPDKVQDMGTEETPTEDDFAFQKLCARWKVDKAKEKPKTVPAKKEPNTVVIPDNEEEFSFGKLQERWKADQAKGGLKIPTPIGSKKHEEPKELNVAVTKEESDSIVEQAVVVSNEAEAITNDVPENSSVAAISDDDEPAHLVQEEKQAVRPEEPFDTTETEPHTDMPDKPSDESTTKNENDSTEES
uniref:BRCT domain-containing protein n=2 Tax=Ditylum brightwellii TaxID=49249 RepID=A0A7S4QQR9_9STRA